MAALGCESVISKLEVSRIGQGLDTQAQAFLDKPLEFSRYPYCYLEATYLHGRDQAHKQVIFRAVIVAVCNCCEEAQGLRGSRPARGAWH